MTVDKVDKLWHDITPYLWCGIINLNFSFLDTELHDSLVSSMVW